MKNDIKKIAKTIKATDSNVLVIQAQQETVMQIADGLDRMGIRVFVIGVDSLEDIVSLNETDMAKFGWFRREAIEKIDGPAKPDALLRIRRHRPYNERYQDLDDRNEVKDEQEIQ